MCPSLSIPVSGKLSVPYFIKSFPPRFHRHFSFPNTHSLLRKKNLLAREKQILRKPSSAQFGRSSSSFVLALPRRNSHRYFHVIAQSGRTMHFSTTHFQTPFLQTSPFSSFDSQRSHSFRSTHNIDSLQFADTISERKDIDQAEENAERHFTIGTTFRH